VNAVSSWVVLAGKWFVVHFEQESAFLEVAVVSKLCVKHVGNLLPCEMGSSFRITDNCCVAAWIGWPLKTGDPVLRPQENIPTPVAMATNFGTLLHYDYIQQHSDTHSVWCRQYHFLWFLLLLMCKFFNVAVNRQIPLDKNHVRDKTGRFDPLVHFHKFTYIAWNCIKRMQLQAIYSQ